MTQIKYFAVNEEIENQIKSIRRTIYLSMNGICAENIDNSGLEYKQNFGVSWSRLCEIAQNYTPNYTLAERLWLMSIRETKLLATLLCPPLELTFFRSPSGPYPERRGHSADVEYTLPELEMVFRNPDR